MIVLLKLLIAHFIGDFFLQSKALVRQKSEKKLASPFLWVHALLHGILAWAILWESEFWYVGAIVGVSHLLIDLAKVYYDPDGSHRHSFLIDQLLHVAVIIGLVYYIEHPDIKQFILNKEIYTGHVFGLVLALLLLTAPSAFFLRTFFSQYNITALEGANGLPNAGLWIGILERLLVFVFIITHHWEGVGFLIAAKSVFRFGDLSKSANMQLTEYVMMGTLMSFAIAIAVGLGYLFII